jgi:hypothetical protein
MGIETLAIMAVAGTVVSAGGAVYQGMAANTEGKSAQNMADYNADLAKQEAKAIEARGAVEQRLQAEEAARSLSSTKAGLGASGAVTTAGSPLLIQATQAAESEMDNLWMGYNTAVDASQARSQAAISRMEGKLARQKGRNKATGSYIGAGASLLTGFSGAGGAKGGDAGIMAKHQKNAAVFGVK